MASWLAFGLVVVALLLLGLLVIALIVAVQAGWRGYPIAAWLVAGFLGNPVYLLVLLGAMPDFARRKLRDKERTDLEKRLGTRVKRLPAVVAELAEPPRDPSPAIQRSLGDMPTYLPERSLGDDETSL